MQHFSGWMIAILLYHILRRSICYEMLLFGLGHSILQGIKASNPGCIVNGQSTRPGLFSRLRTARYLQMNPLSPSPTLHIRGRTDSCFVPPFFWWPLHLYM